jgi:hypothetical protein
MFDEAAFLEMEWVKKLSEEARRDVLEGRVGETMDIENPVGRREDSEIRHLADSRYSAYQFGELAYFLELIDRNHLHLDAGYGRTYPFTRVPQDDNY